VGEIRVEVLGGHDWNDTFVADNSLVAAIVLARGDGLSDLPRLLVVPELELVVAQVAASEPGSDRAAEVLFAGSGHQEHMRGKLSPRGIRATQLLAHLRRGSQDAVQYDGPESAPPADLSTGDAVEVVARIRNETVALSKQRGVPIVAVRDGFRRSLAGIPALIYPKVVGQLSSIRQRIRGSMDSDSRCLWFVFLAKVTGACIDTHLAVGGTPTGDIAMMMDPLASDR
jgi:hypothetical protein